MVTMQPVLPLVLRRLDDYQSWQITWQGTALLIDPWLTEHPIRGSFDRVHGPGYATWDDLAQQDIAAVLLCTGVNDHARPESLSLLPDIPVLGPRGAAAVARRAGCQQVSAVRVGEQHTFQCRQGGTLTVTVTRTGFPLGLIAVGYVIEARDSMGAVRGRLWLDPHLPRARQARAARPIDVALLPCHGVMAVVMPVTLGPRGTARVARAAQSASVVPTATDPRRDMSAWQRVVYRVGGGVGATAEQLEPLASIQVLTAGEELLITHT